MRVCERARVSVEFIRAYTHLSAHTHMQTNTVISLGAQIYILTNYIRVCLRVQSTSNVLGLQCF